LRRCEFSLITAAKKRRARRHFNSSSSMQLSLIELPHRSTSAPGISVKFLMRLPHLTLWIMAAREHFCQSFARPLIKKALGARYLIWTSPGKAVTQSGRYH
jgi:hypothetical protein